MQKRIGPWLLLTTLIVVLVFIGGVRYGQRVEKTNEQVEATLSVTPTKTPEKADLKFSTYSNKRCGLEFLYPAHLQVRQLASTSAQFTAGGSTVISFSCGRTDPFEKMLTGSKTATQEIIFQDKPVITTVQEEKSIRKFFLTIQNPVTNQFNYFILQENLYPLFEKSLEFTAVKE